MHTADTTPPGEAEAVIELTYTSAWSPHHLSFLISQHTACFTQFADVSPSMASTAPSVIPTDSRKVVIKGLEKVQHAEKTDQRGSKDEDLELPTFSMTMQEEEPLCELWDRIES